MSPRPKKINATSTKAEILAAYQAAQKALEQKEKAVAATPASKPSPAYSAPVRTPAPDVSSRGMSAVISEISQLKITVGKYLADLEEAMVREDGRLADIRTAIADGEKRLKELHDIEVAADTLEQLRTTHEEKNARFEQVTAERKKNWLAEKERFETAMKEKEAEILKKRKREEDEYAYSLKIARKKEQDAYAEKRAKQEKEWAEKIRARETELKAREAEIAAREAEFSRLQSEIETFPKTLEKEIKQAEKQAAEAAVSRLQMEKIILEKDNEREKELLTLQIETQQAKIAEQSARIERLEKDLKDAAMKTHSIANKVIDGISAAKSPAPSVYRSPQAPAPNPQG